MRFTLDRGELQNKDPFPPLDTSTIHTTSIIQTHVCSRAQTLILHPNEHSISTYSPIARIPSASLSACWRAEDSRRSSLTTCASASGFTPLSVCE